MVLVSVVKHLHVLVNLKAERKYFFSYNYNSTVILPETCNCTLSHPVPQVARYGIHTHVSAPVNMWKNLHMNTGNERTYLEDLIYSNTNISLLHQFQSATFQKVGFHS